MLPEYSRAKSETLAQISTPIAKIQNFFYRGLCFIGAPCTIIYKNITRKYLKLFHCYGIFPQNEKFMSRVSPLAIPLFLKLAVISLQR